MPRPSSHHRGFQPAHPSRQYALHRRNSAFAASASATCLVESGSFPSSELRILVSRIWRRAVIWAVLLQRPLMATAPCPNGKLHFRRPDGDASVLLSSCVVVNHCHSVAYILDPQTLRGDDLLGLALLYEPIHLNLMAMVVGESIVNLCGV